MDSEEESELEADYMGFLGNCEVLGFYEVNQRLLQVLSRGKKHSTLKDHFDCCVVNRCRRTGKEQGDELRDHCKDPDEEQRVQTRLVAVGKWSDSSCELKVELVGFLD